MKYILPTAMALAASLVLAASCVTSSKATPPPPAPVPPPIVSEEDSIKAGAALFSEGKIAEAQDAWAAIADPEKRSLYVSFARAYADFEESVTEAETLLAASGPDAAIAAAGKIEAPPVPPGVGEAGAADPRGAGERLARVRAQAGSALVARASQAESAADAELDGARSGKAKDPAGSAGKAQDGYAAAARLYRGATDVIAEAEADARRADEKANAADELRKRILKESLLSFPERMGEVFARTPSPSNRLGDKELLAFNAETAAIITGGLSEFDRIVSEYPDILDPASVERLRDSIRSLSVRFSRIESTIKAVKDRGKPLMPLIIGIFNPQPGDPQRSRPASFGGSLRGGSDWWWGIADIPKSLAQDLVITMSDARPVRVYAAGLSAGSKRPSSDLVNPLFKVGNSWPVLNAGARLENGVFHIEVGPSRSEEYKGEAVVYKSFMTRTR